MLLYMLDTDTSVFIMRRSKQAVLARLISLPVNSLCLSMVTKAELLLGVELSPQRQRNQITLERFLAHVQVLDYDATAALHYAQIRAQLQDTGRMIGANDLHIAAHARSLDLTLVTNNMREFSRVRGLRLENWATDPDSPERIVVGGRPTSRSG